MNESARRFMLGGRDDLDLLERVMSSADALLRAMDAEGIARAALINSVAPDVIGITDLVNPWIARYVEGHRDRLVPVGGVHPRHSRHVARGMRGALDLYPPAPGTTPPRPPRPGGGDPPEALPRRRRGHEEASRRLPPRRDQAAPAPHGDGRERLQDRLPLPRRRLPPGGRGEAAGPDPHGDVHLPRRPQRLRGPDGVRRRGGRLPRDDPRPLPRRPPSLVRNGVLPREAPSKRPARHLGDPAAKAPRGSSADLRDRRSRPVGNRLALEGSPLDGPERRRFPLASSFGGGAAEDPLRQRRRALRLEVTARGASIPLRRCWRSERLRSATSTRAR